MRGMLTEEIVSTAKELLDIELTQEQLRLLPYIQYVMMNEKCIVFNKLDHNELDILHDWIAKGWITNEQHHLSISKPFWDAMNAILWLGYASSGESE